MNAFAIADRYWAAHFGVAEDAFLAEPKRIVTHTGELAGYEGVLALSRAGAFIFSLPPDRLAELGPVLRGLPANPDWSAVVTALRPFSRLILGPAYVGYADTVPSLATSARAVTNADISAVAALEIACGPEEWEHGGCDVAEQPASGVFIRGTLAALAGYEIWGGTIAHICVVTHPAFRGRGHGTAVVAHLAARMLQSGLVPQYRTLLSNAPSMRVAQKLGFGQYGSTIAARM
ncbi:MAG: GNAT family N-acetyltransferase [Chthoniobacteraceae bacterium]